MRILGLTTLGGAATTLVVDGEVVAAVEEERFSRRKHHSGFPVNAVEYCLAEGAITIADVDHVSLYWKPWIIGRKAFEAAKTLAVPRGASPGHVLLDPSQATNEPLGVVLRSLFCQISSMSWARPLPSPSACSAVMPVLPAKYSMRVPSKPSKTTKRSLSAAFSPRRVPRPSICSNKIRDLTGPGKTRNSRSGMSTPVVSRSTVTTMPGLGRLRNSRMRCRGRSTRPVILATNASPCPKMSRAWSTSWSECEVCGRSLAAKISVFGNRPCSASCASV
jgi:hypothetical protein